MKYKFVFHNRPDLMSRQDYELENDTAELYQK